MIRRSRAALGSAAFFVVAPGTVIVLIPWLISHWEFHQPLPYWLVAQVIGGLMVVMGLVVVASVFVEFVKAGGTPMPLAPTQRLVVSGFNRYIRNPLYFGSRSIILGQALLFGSLGVLIYSVIMWVVPAAFMHWYEERTLARQFGAEYEAYRRAVPAWWPRLHPWTPSQHERPEPRTTDSL